MQRSNYTIAAKKAKASGALSLDAVFGKDEEDESDSDSSSSSSSSASSRSVILCVCVLSRTVNDSLAIADLPLPRSLLHRARAVATRNPSHLQRRSVTSFIISFRKRRRRRVSGGTSARVNPSPSVPLQVLQDCARSLLQADRCWLLHSHWSRSDGRWSESISGMLAGPFACFLPNIRKLATVCVQIMEIVNVVETAKIYALEDTKTNKVRENSPAIA